MATKTIKIEHDKIRDPQTITQVQEKAFKEHGLDMHVNEVVSINDDMANGVRHLEVKCTKYFTVGEVPWHKN